jgi:hypothetical protein
MRSDMHKGKRPSLQVRRDAIERLNDMLEVGCPGRQRGSIRPRAGETSGSPD